MLTAAVTTKPRRAPLLPPAPRLGWARVYNFGGGGDRAGVKSRDGFNVSRVWVLIPFVEDPSWMLRLNGWRHPPWRTRGGSERITSVETNRRLSRGKIFVRGSLALSSIE